MYQLPPRPDAPLKVGISACLTGQEVRYDGTGAKSSLPGQHLLGLFDYQAFCPEVAIGMSVPRPPIRLVESDQGDVRVVGVKDSGLDKTSELREYGDSVAEQVASNKLAGYIFMHNSPSCGLYRVKVYSRADVPGERKGRGAFAAALTAALPDLPVEDAGRLFDDVLRENFVTRAFAYAHWRIVRQELSAEALIAYHAAYKYLLMAHSIDSYKSCGRLLSNLKGDLAEKADRYIGLLMQGLTKPASRGGHANVLSHLQGYLKRRLDATSRQELDQLIQAYRRGEQPLLAPLTLLKHHFRNHPDEYVLKQSYLEPHPTAAGLRAKL